MRDYGSELFGECVGDFEVAVECLGAESDGLVWRGTVVFVGEGFEERPEMCSVLFVRT